MFLFYVLTFFKKGDIIQGGTLFKGGHYLRKYGSLLSVASVSAVILVIGGVAISSANIIFIFIIKLLIFIEYIYLENNYQIRSYMLLTTKGENTDALVWVPCATGITFLSFAHSLNVYWQNKFWHSHGSNL